MKYKGEIILAVLFLYVVALGIVTYDEVFREPPHLFPPPLEKEVIVAVEQFRSSDARLRSEAQGKVLNIEDFVTVPVLIHYLRDNELTVRKLAADTLERIGLRLQGHTELPPQFRADGPSTAWVEGQRQWKQWMKENEERL